MRASLLGLAKSIYYFVVALNRSYLCRDIDVFCLTSALNKASGKRRQTEKYGNVKEMEKVRGKV